MWAHLGVIEYPIHEVQPLVLEAERALEPTLEYEYAYGWDTQYDTPHGHKVTDRIGLEVAEASTLGGIVHPHDHSALEDMGERQSHATDPGCGVTGELI